MAEQRGKMTQTQSKEILRQCTYGILSTCGEDGSPYGVPLNYFFREEENAIYFHCAKKGKKLDHIRKNDRVSFAVVAKEEIVQEQFTTHYQSVILEGRASIVEHDEEKKHLLRQLCEQLAPNAVERREEVIEKYLPAVCLVKIDIETLSGKNNRED